MAEDDLSNGEIERLFHLHGELREELRRRIRQSSRPFLGGIGGTATIVGYAVAEDIPRVLAVVPLIVVYAAFRSLVARHEMVRVTKHVGRIEEKLAPDGGTFRYERQYGGAF